MSPRLLLVHSPLVGRESWEPVAADLAGHGYEAGLPDLTGTVAAGPPYWAAQAGAIAREAGGQPVILVGHSGAGPLLAAASTVIGDVRGYVFVDAGLPAPGRSWMETAPPELAAQLREMADDEGWLPPWPEWWGDEALAELLPDPRTRRRFAAGCPRLPLAMFEEAWPPAPRWADAPGAYLLLSEAYEGEAARARELGWPVAERISHHLALLTDPGPVAASLRELIGALQRALPGPGDRIVTAMPAVPPLPETPVVSIAEAIARMEAIEAALPAADGLACFNRMYLDVTRQVNSQLGQGFFADPAFMTQLDVTFANLYFAAADVAQNPAAVPLAWRPLAERRAVAGIEPIQFALAGMNAHINHDLPLAMVSTCATLATAPDASPHFADYQKVDQLLDAAEQSVRQSFETAPELAVDRHLSAVCDLIANWTINSARDMAWNNCLLLWAVRDDPVARGLFQDTLAASTALAGRMLLTAV